MAAAHRNGASLFLELRTGARCSSDSLVELGLLSPGPPAISAYFPSSPSRFERVVTEIDSGARSGSPAARDAHGLGVVVHSGRCQR